MRATQKKMMSKPVTSDVGRVVALHFRRLVRPAERRERPQRRGEPGVEHVLVAGDEALALGRVVRHLARPALRRDDFLLDVIAERVADRLLLGLGDEHLAVRPVPRRESDGPTRAGARCTRAGCSPSSRNRSFPSSSARSWSRPSAPPRSPAAPGSWRRRTTGRSGTARSRRRSGRHAAPCACSARSSRGSRILQPRHDRLARGEAVDAVQLFGEHASAPSGKPRR